MAPAWLGSARLGWCPTVRITITMTLLGLDCTFELIQHEAYSPLALVIKVIMR